MQARQAHPGRSPAEALSEAEASLPPSRQPRYKPGVALPSVRMFDCGPGADSASYLVEMASLGFIAFLTLSGPANFA